MKGAVSGAVNVGEEGKGGEAGQRRLDCRWTEGNESARKTEMLKAEEKDECKSRHVEVYFITHRALLDLLLS